MCDPISATIGVASAGASFFGNRQKNKSLNKMARAQAAAARENFFNERIAIETNADASLTDLELQATEVAKKQAKEEGAIIAAIGGGNIVAGQSASKIFQSVVAQGGVNKAAIQGTKQNKIRQIQNQFDINKGNYEANIAEIKSNLNQKFKSGTSMAIDAFSAGLSGAATGLQISTNIAQAKAAKAQTNYYNSLGTTTPTGDGG